MNYLVRFLAALVSISIIGCSSVKTEKMSDWTGYTESGKASFYADKHQHNKTASGELYNHDLKTAAHRSLPFGTRVKVTNIKNGKTVIVRINDRGPFIKGRVVDLSKSAFSSIGFPSSGLIDVKIEVIK
ncbi:septal ring lytic transglycosylase RlpA family protein [Marinobacterium aestuariivivens]|uniref:Endolytic peptidoglycan transglycosylase RlpA n=1 Tax=Marinobacterium aestuariivivens TaxID=1698799 RepID=A0ABW2A4I5_9GAMM